MDAPCSFRNSLFAFIQLKNFETKNQNLTKLGCCRFYLSQGESQFRRKKPYNTITQLQNLHCGQQWYYKDECNLYESLTKVKMQPKGKKCTTFQIKSILSLFFTNIFFFQIHLGLSILISVEFQTQTKERISKGTSLVQTFEAWKV